MAGKRSKRTPREGVDGLGRTPLHYAAAEGRHEDLADLLLGRVDPNIQDDAGWSALHFAAQANSPACVSALLRAGAVVSLQDSFGNTALFRAVFACAGDGSVILLLREAGADPVVKNKHGVSAASLARRIANHDVARFFSDIEELGDAP